VPGDQRAQVRPEPGEQPVKQPGGLVNAERSRLAGG